MVAQQEDWRILAFAHGDACGPRKVIFGDGGGFVFHFPLEVVANVGDGHRAHGGLGAGLIRVVNEAGGCCAWNGDQADFGVIFEGVIL
jgi:hypothetical protein